MPSQSGSAFDPLEWCRQGMHDVRVDGARRCVHCGALAGSVLDTDPYDFGAAADELRSVHEYLRGQGLQQSDDDGQWGRVEGYWTPEWSEVGNTVQAIQQVASEHGAEGFHRALSVVTMEEAATERVAKALCAEGIHTLSGKPATWEQHADGFRSMARAALSAAARFYEAPEEATADAA